jgi:two-component system, sensor histidine kinase and response regulator
MEAGRVRLESAEFSLQDCINEILEAPQVQARQKGLELECALQPEVPERVIGDAARVRQLLMSLIGNAIKFTERGDIKLDVAVERQACEDCVLHFTVTDTGIGIPEDKQRLIFEAFSQVDGSSTREHGGTGLGLAIASRLVEMMHGRIWVESEPGRGSRFHFTAHFEKAMQMASFPSHASLGTVLQGSSL